METGLVDLLSFGLIGTDTNDTTRSLRTEIAELCLALLPNGIGLSDAFGLTDWELDRYDLTINSMSACSTFCPSQVPLGYMTGVYTKPYGTEPR